MRYICWKTKNKSSVKCGSKGYCNEKPEKVLKEKGKRLRHNRNIFMHYVVQMTMKWRKKSNKI